MFDKNKAYPIGAVAAGDRPMIDIQACCAINLIAHFNAPSPNNDVMVQGSRDGQHWQDFALTSEAGEDVYLIQLDARLTRFLRFSVTADANLLVFSGGCRNYPVSQLYDVHSGSLCTTSVPKADCMTAELTCTGGRLADITLPGMPTVVGPWDDSNWDHAQNGIKAKLGNSVSDVTKNGDTYTLKGQFSATVQYNCGGAQPLELTQDGPVTTNAGTSVTVDLLGNDSDPSGGTLSVVSVHGVTITDGGPAVQIPGGHTARLVGGVVSLQPADGYTGTLTCQYQVASTSGATGQSQFTVVVEPNNTNNPPVAQGNLSNQTNPEDAPITPLDVSDDFSDPDGDTLTYSATDLPPGLSIDENTGVISGTPTDPGTTTVTVTATDPDGETATSTFDWVVTPVATNNPPVVNNTLPDRTNVEDTAISPVDITDGFSDPDGDTLTYAATGLPNGLSINPSTGAISGTPTDPATSTVTVTATDPDGESVSQTFDWVVNPVNPTNNPPVAQGNLPDQTHPEDTAITPVNVSGEFSDPDGDTLTYSVAGLPDGLTINSSTGVITGTPTTPGDSTVTITATDPGGLQATSTFDWMITPVAVNGPPVAEGNLPDQNNPEDTAITPVDVSGDFSDPDGDTLTYSATGLPNGLSIDPTTGVISGTPTDPDTSTVTVTATDPDGETATSSFEWVVTPENQAPVKNGTFPNQSFTVGDTVNLDVAPGFSDPDGDTLTYVANGLPDGLGISAQGVINGTPSSEGTFNVTVSAYDPSNLFSECPFTITIVAQGAKTCSANITDFDPGNNRLTVSVTPDSSRPCYVSVGRLRNGTFQLSDETPSPVLFNGQTEFNFSSPTQHGDSFALQVSDDAGGSNIACQDIKRFDAITVVDTNGNQLPCPIQYPITLTDNTVLSNDTELVAYANSNLPDTDWTLNSDCSMFRVIPQGEPGAGNLETVPSTSLTANDDTVNTPQDTQVTIPVISNDDNPDGTNISVTHIDGTAVSPGDTVTLADGHTVQLQPDHVLLFTPAAGVTGPVSFDYSIRDGENNTDTGTVTVNIQAASNGPPVAQGNLPDQSDPEDSAITSVDVSGDFSAPDGDSLTFSASGLPTGLTIDPNTGVITGTPSDPGTTTVTITAQDPAGATATSTFDWTVTPVAVNQAPVAQGNLPDQSDPEDAAITPVDVSGDFSDPDGDTLSYSASGLPSGLTIDSNTGVISGTPTDPGTSTVTITATDPDGETATSTFDWVVTPVATRDCNTDPVTLGEPSFSGGVFSVDLGGIDPAGGDVTLTVTENGSPVIQATASPGGSLQGSASGPAAQFFLSGQAANGTLTFDKGAYAHGTGKYDKEHDLFPDGLAVTGTGNAVGWDLVVEQDGCTSPTRCLQQSTFSWIDHAKPVAGTTQTSASGLQIYTAGGMVSFSDSTLPAGDDPCANGATTISGSGFTHAFCTADPGGGGFQYDIRAAAGATVTGVQSGGPDYEITNSWPPSNPNWTNNGGLTAGTAGVDHSGGRTIAVATLVACGTTQQLFFERDGHTARLQVAQIDSY